MDSDKTQLGSTSNDISNLVNVILEGVGFGYSGNLNNENTWILILIGVLINRNLHGSNFLMRGPNLQKVMGVSYPLTIIRLSIILLPQIQV